MSRATLILNTMADRNKAREWITKAPPGTRVEFKRVKRTLPQNDRMWAMLTDIADQKEHMGMKLNTEVWKSIFYDAALNIKTTYVPTLDGQSVIPLGYRTSELSKEEMSDLLECMMAWGAENGVIFHDQPEQREDAA